MGLVISRGSAPVLCLASGGPPNFLSIQPDSGRDALGRRASVPAGMPADAPGPQYPIGPTQLEPCRRWPGSRPCGPAASPSALGDLRSRRDPGARHPCHPGPGGPSPPSPRGPSPPSPGTRLPNSAPPAAPGSPGFSLQATSETAVHSAEDRGARCHIRVGPGQGVACRAYQPWTGVRRCKDSGPHLSTCTSVIISSN